MNKRARVVQRYSKKEIMKAMLMFLITGAFPIAVTITAGVNIVLLFMTSFYTVITLMALVISMIIMFSSHVFITTLKQFNMFNDIDYRRVYFSIGIPLSLLALFLSYYISTQFL